MNFEEKLNHGFELLQDKDIDHALDIARELQKENEDSHEAYYLEALIFQQLEQFDLSLKNINKAIELDDENAAYFNLRGNIRMNKEELKEAEEDFDKVIEVNLKSVFNLTKAVIRPMMKQRKGSIINMSSVVGLKGNAGQTNYAASKAGIIGFSKSVALELGSRNIRSNVIAPGFIETEMTAKRDQDTVEGWRKAIPLRRGGTPEDIANVCVFLASDMSAYVTGQTLNVDGGMLT